ncbi:2822_t:CDS:2 [Ambispora gerdemannii]|uniref:2822_t:CDS:1 n=1 Tax=Ambispora gerdemannii TaxID=144530 RepID=A0A9N9BSN9_9GLOM|nr:2822_t:CDS:2 [Ambispora gerdemannii]
MGNCISGRDKNTASRSLSSKDNEKKSSQQNISNDEAKKYPLPNTDDENDRMTSQHFLQVFYLFLSFHHNNDLSGDKLRSGRARVLDIGCGPGTWVLDMANDYTLSQFTGVDISATFPNSVKPMNVNFEQCDVVNEKLPFETDTFDLIHVRFMGSCFTEVEWSERVIPDLFRVLKPGGYIEIMDLDMKAMNEGPSTNELLSAIQAQLTSKKINPIITPLLDKFLESAGIVDIDIEENCHPIGEWGDKLGVIALNDLSQWFNQLKSELAPFMRLSDEDYDEKVGEFRREVNNFQTYWLVYRLLFF